MRLSKQLNVLLANFNRQQVKIVVMIVPLVNIAQQEEWHLNLHAQLVIYAKVPQLALMLLIGVQKGIIAHQELLYLIWQMLISVLAWNHVLKVIGVLKDQAHLSLQ
jgi:hypothetical protein